LRPLRRFEVFERHRWARDISESGIGAFVAHELVSGEQVEIEVPLDNDVKLTLQARVTRTLGTQYGLMFTTMSPEQRAQIQLAVAGKAPLPSHFPEASS